MGTFSMPGSGGLGTGGSWTGGPMTLDQMSNYINEANGGGVPTMSIIDPPDDRYLPGYTKTDADGDKTMVGPRLKDLNVPFSLYGLQIPITFGVRRLYGNILWAIPLRESVKKKKSGGKGGGPDTKSTTYSYFATFAVSFGVAGLPDMASRDLLRIWADGTLIFDRRSTGRTKISALHYEFYKGTNTQTADPTMEAQEGVGNVPGYRDLMYLVIKDLPVGEFGNRPPAISVEVGDATSVVYSIENIATPAFAGSSSTNAFMPDFESQLMFMARRITNSTASIRTYNLLNNTYMGAAPLNQGDGVGWVSNTLIAALSHATGANASSTYTYIPWLQQAVIPAGSAGGCPIMLIEPLSGAIIDWCGSFQATTQIQYEPTSLSPTVGPGPSPCKGTIPTPKHLTPFKAVGLLGITTFIFVSTIYNTNGLMMTNFDNPLHVIAKLTAATVTASCPGEEGLGTGSVYFSVGTGIRKVTAVYDAALVSNISFTGITEDLTWYTGLPASVEQMLYYASDESLIVFCSDNSIHKIDIATKTIVWSTTSTDGPFVNTANWWLSDISSGTAAWMDFTGRVRELDLVFGTGQLFIEANTKFESITGAGWHDSRSRSIVNRTSTGDGLPATQEGLLNACSQLFYDRLSDERMLLSDFILGMAIIAGYLEADIIIDPNIDDEIDGAIIASSVSFRSMIDAIMAIYRIDVIESDGKIKFIRAAVGGGAVAYTVVEDDLLTTESAAPEVATFQFRREEEVVVPQRVQLRYIDKTLGYQISMQMATRSQLITTNSSTEQITYEVPIIMSASEAKALANRALWSAWTSRVSYAYRLGPEFLDVEPGDIGQVTADGIQYKIRSVEVSYNFDKSVSIKGQNFLTDEAIIVVGDSGAGYDYELPAVASSEIFIFDIPLLRGSDDLSYTNNNYPFYWYVGPKLLEATWSGGTGFMARDLFTYQEMGSNIEQGFTAMVAVAPTIPDNLFETDYTNTITVVPRSGDQDLLVSATTEEVLAGANLAAYGRNGRWELIQFETVTDNGDSTFTLSNLLRARRGTDKQVDLHLPGDYFVLIDETFTDMSVLFFADLNKSVDFKGVGFGQVLNDVIANRVVITGYGGLPWPVGAETMDRTIGGDGDITINWARRSRTSGEMADLIENAPLTIYEENEYQITLYRWPHYEYAWSGTEWIPTLVSDATVTINVADAETFELSDSLIRTHQLYEFQVPDDLFDEFSTDSQVSCDTIPANAAQNLIAVDLGYDEWHAFTYLDIVIQQKTNIPNDTGYGPGRRRRILIRDNV